MTLRYCRDVARGLQNDEYLMNSREWASYISDYARLALLLTSFSVSRI
jgi:hypothetical protein